MISSGLFQFAMAWCATQESVSKHPPSGSRQRAMATGLSCSCAGLLTAFSGAATVGLCERHIYLRNLHLDTMVRTYVQFYCFANGIGLCGLGRRSGGGCIGS